MNCMANSENSVNDNYLAFCCLHKEGREVEGRWVTLLDRGCAGTENCAFPSCSLSGTKYVRHPAAFLMLTLIIVIKGVGQVLCAKP